ncbi:MAG TPA: SPOR domain-containing protein [Coxiellaceae bacterium]|nr:SPOR domain-containing protein [Coxiellaceae bacterium]
MKHYLPFSLLLASLTLASCHKQPLQQTDSQKLTVCKANAFLQKYGCSLDNVEEAASHGDPDAEYALGYMYYYGIDTVQDSQTAKTWIERAAHQGQPLATKALAMLNEKSYPDMGQVTADNKPPVQNTSNATDLKFTEKQEDLKPVDASEAQGVTKPASAAPLVETPVASSPVTANTPSAVTTTARSTYTLQLIGSHNLPQVEHFMAKHGIEKTAHLAEVTRNGKPWYIVTYGDYPTSAEAVAAKRSLPASLKNVGAWVKEE